MASDFYLALTAAEFYNTSHLPEHCGWMACHFSPYGPGLSNKPCFLPPKSMLILNDLMPVNQHDPQRLTMELQEIITNFSVSRLLLDLQRPGVEQTKQIVDCILNHISCDIGISHHYAVKGYPVLVPPIPLYMAAKDYLKPWENQKIWLELTAEPLCLEITEDGCKEVFENPDKKLQEHWDSGLFCHYRTKISDDRIRFYLYRKQNDMPAYLEYLSPLGVECGIGLYQEFGYKKTALQT